MGALKAILLSDNETYNQSIKAKNITDDIAFFTEYSQKIVEKRLQTAIKTFIHIIINMEPTALNERISVKLSQLLTPSTTILEDFRDQDSDSLEEYRLNIEVNTFNSGRVKQKLIWVIHYNLILYIKIFIIHIYFDPNEYIKFLLFGENDALKKLNMEYYRKIIK